MSEQLPTGDYPPPPWGGYPPPQAFGGYPPPQAFGGYLAHNYPAPALRGLVTLPAYGIVQVATIWQRLLAKLVDGVCFILVYAICFGIGFAASARDPYWHHPHHVAAVVTVELLMVLGLVAIIGLLYEWLMIGLKGATLGKMALRIRVVNQTTGEPPGLGPAFLRWLIPAAASWFCSLLVLVVYLSPLFDETGREQGWHDKAANDLVIKLP